MRKFFTGGIAVLSALSFFVLSVPWAAAAVPSMISFQGRLTDASGNLLGGSGTNYFFKFTLFDSATSGTQVWPPSTPPAITLRVTQGVFNTLLGDTSAGYSVLDADFSKPSLWLEVQVSDDGSAYETLTPRQRIAASGYAINADSVHGGEFINASGVGQFGALATVAYSRFGTNTTSHGLTGPSQALFSGTTEFDGQVFIDNSASVSLNLEVGGYASASQFFGGGLSACTGGNQKLQYDAVAGVFSCGVMTASSNFSGIGVGLSGGTFSHVTSLSFDANMFTLANTASLSSIGLNWVTGPASRSADQTITGQWNFTAPGSSSFAGSLNIAKGLTANSFQGGGLSVCTGAGQFLRYSGGQYSCGTIADADIPDTITASNYLLLTGGTLNGNLIGTGASFSAGEFTTYASAQAYRGGLITLTGTASNSFAGSLNVLKGLTANSFQGGGLTLCTGSQFTQYSNGQFGCGTPATGGGAWKGLSLATIGGTFSHVGSLSFDANMFSLSAVVASNSNIRLNWSTGPASRSAINTWSALNTFSSALVIPAAIGGPTQATAGGLSVDTASNSLNFYGTAENILSPKRCFYWVQPLPNLTANRQFTIKPYFNDPFTISDISVRASGSNAAGWNLQYGLTTSAMTSIFSANKSASGSATSVYTAFNGSAIPDGGFLDGLITSASANISSFTVQVCGAINP